MDEAYFEKSDVSLVDGKMIVMTVIRIKKK